MHGGQLHELMYDSDGNLDFAMRREVVELMLLSCFFELKACHRSYVAAHVVSGRERPPMQARLEAKAVAQESVYAED